MFSTKRVLPAAAIAVLLGGACTDETVVFRDPFNSPADSVGGFLGYFDPASKQTTCGNCHADEQRTWSETLHASAFANLEATGAAQDFCRSCHSVNELGNPVVGAAGWNVTKDETYHDVQCESCHGPGIDHVMDPAAVQPLASLVVDVDLTSGCGECHQGTHHPFVEQWSESAHGNTSSFARGREPCAQCHEGVRALEVNFGVSPRFLEEGSDELLPITCPVCHDPHAVNNPKQLRAPLDVESKHQLCITCHNRRTVPAEGTRGPHAAQGPLLLNDNIGWWPPGLEFSEGLTATHGNPQVNTRLCATCHVSSFEVTDPASGDHLFTATGHTFEAIPCTDAEGVPVPGPCADTDRTFEACAVCHGSESGARANFLRFRAELDSLLGVIWDDINADDHIDPAPTDGGLLPGIVAAFGPDELNRGDTLFTFAEGILFNAQLAATHTSPRFLDGFVVLAPDDTLNFSAHPTSGNGVHNPPLLDALLKASIAAGADYYNIVLPSPAIDLKFRWWEAPAEWKFNR